MCDPSKMILKTNKKYPLFFLLSIHPIFLCITLFFLPYFSLSFSSYYFSSLFSLLLLIMIVCSLFFCKLLSSFKLTSPAHILSTCMHEISCCDCSLLFYEIWMFVQICLFFLFAVMRQKFWERLVRKKILLESDVQESDLNRCLTTFDLVSLGTDVFACQRL